MATPPEERFDVVAAHEAAALADAAASRQLDAAELEIVGREALSRLPWQPKRYRFSILRRPPAIASHDGHWEVDYHLGSVWLTVYPPQGSGRPVMPEELLSARRGWPVTTSFDRERLYSVIEKASGEAVAVADYDTPRDEAFRGLISPNDMAGFLVFGVNWQGVDPLKDALAALEAAGCVFGIDVERISVAVTEGVPGKAFLVAEGAEAEAGEDAQLLQTFSPASPQIRSDGGVDFTACQLDEPVAVGEPLLMLQPAELGPEGHTVRGATLPATFGKEIDLSQYLGKGVTLSDDGLQVIATISGTPQRVGDKISILPLLRIPRNVDRTTGNIDFPGNVVIDGDVTDGFRVRAEGDLTVKGVVQGAHLESSGAVILENGMFGRGVGEITAKGYIQAEFLEECTASTETDVLVSKEIVRSTVSAGNSVLAGEGRLIGGVISATHEILAGVVGTVSGTLTRLLLVPGPNAKLTLAASPSDPQQGQGGGRQSVRIHDRIYAPAQISIGMLKFVVEHETPYCRFIESNGRIVVTVFA